MRTLKESLLDNVKDTIKKGDDDVKIANALVGQYTMTGIAGIGDSTEKLFDNNVLVYQDVSYLSDKFQGPRWEKEFPRFPKYKCFAKFLERLQPGDLGLNKFELSTQADANKFAELLNTYAKKEGIIKKPKNIRILVKHLSEFLLIQVGKVDATDNFVKTKTGSVVLYYYFQPR